MLIRREAPADVDAIRAVHVAAFAAPDAPDATPVEATLVDALRADEGWLPALSLVATDPQGQVVGHVVCTRGWV
ncbi:GNAT family N-acetyltransferase, partial [Micromonospora sp. 15K316]